MIIVNDNEEESWVAAFDKVTATARWTTQRDDPSTCATPFSWHHDGRLDPRLSVTRRPPHTAMRTPTLSGTS